MEIGSFHMGGEGAGMTYNSVFHSRTAKPDCTSEEFYNFITDLRNFGQFIPGRSVENWQAGPENCTFSMPPMGEISLKLQSKSPFSEVVFSGVVLSTTNFLLNVYISGTDGKPEIKMMMEAELGPMMKMMASGPIERFLEALAGEMERFREWKK